jgi:CubicO group peptidase (beta-lactamase class C family)
MKHSSHPLFIILMLATIFSVASGFAANPKPPASPEVAAAMQPYLDSYKLAGIIGIIADKEGRVHYENLIGYADVEAKKPISEDNVFWVASMSKMFVGASIMMLVDEGKVSLDDPVTKFIPQFSKWMVIEDKAQIIFFSSRWYARSRSGIC